MQQINIQQFISDHITGRKTSFFLKDIEDNRSRLTDEIEGKSVLVIGGAGTIGSSFIKSVLAFRPAKLVVVDHNENGLTELTRDLRSTQNQYIPPVYLSHPIDFGSVVFENMFLQNGPFDIVANFAAHKHVRSEKDPFSIQAMIENNVFKAKKLLDLLKENPPSHFFCVSTDKAANPVNVMGATKKIMEDVIMSFSTSFPVTTARFANVAFSNGSLLDGYLMRLMKRQPLSCPSDVKRFFVSPEESGQICMLACILGKTGEIFFPKLDEKEMVNFKDITEAFIQETGWEIYLASSEQDARAYSNIRSSEQPYPVYFFKTDTSGEKLYEEFYTENDIVDKESFSSLGIIKSVHTPSAESINTLIFTLKETIEKKDIDKARIVSKLKSVLPGFEHIETGKTLDDKM